MMRRETLAVALGSCVLACDLGPQSSNPDCVGTVEIEAGWFFSGCQPDETTNCSGADPVHSEWLGTFAIDTCEVTVGDYRVCIEAGACPEVHDSDCFGCNIHEGDREDHPMNCGNSVRAEAYCAWVGGRLPTALEFEKAYRGTDGRRFPWGNEAPTCERINYDTCEDRFGPDTDRVGIRLGAASPYGVLDLAGNLRELVFLPPHPDGPERQQAHEYHLDAYAQLGGGYNSPVNHVVPWSARFLNGDYVDGRAGFRCAYDVVAEDEQRPEPPPSETDRPQGDP